MIKTKLKNSWNRLSKHAAAHMTESRVFQNLCEGVYGTNWDMLTSLQDYDPIIDTIDYGIDDLSFEEFDELMIEAIKEKNSSIEKPRKRKEKHD